MVKLIDLLKRGFFPKELPPPFTTEDFGSLLERKPHLIPYLCDDAKAAHLAKHSLFRAGNLRRNLTVPNPMPFLKLSRWFEENWSTVESQCNRSSISLSNLSTSSGDRAVVAAVPFNQHPIHQAKLRAKAKYVLKTDITNCYPSIYTHSISWALHTKAKAKRLRRPSDLVGNELDRLVRNGQDGQSIGIPIGPDTSFIVAEMLLSSVDEEFCNRLDMEGLKPNGYRSYDDYEFGFTTRANAETAITILQRVLSEYELQLNPGKTSIIELPIPIEPTWVSELRSFRINDKPNSWDLRRYFDRAFELSRLNPDSEVLKYAIQRLRSVDITEESWALCEDLLLQCGMVETSSLPVVIDQLHSYKDNGYDLDSKNIRETFSILLDSHVPLGHGSELAWLLWGYLLFDFDIEDSQARAVADMDDPFAALLLLHAQDLGLTHSKVDLSNWQTTFTNDGLREGQWILSYEANSKGWISFTEDYVLSDNRFRVLKKLGVSFYEPQMVASHKPSKSGYPTWGLGGGGNYPGVL